MSRRLSTPPRGPALFAVAGAIVVAVLSAAIDTIGAAADVSPAPAASPAVSSPAPGTLEWPIDPGGTTIHFIIHRPGETIDGTATRISGGVRFDPARPSDGSVLRLTVDPDGMQTGNSIRDRKMKKSHLEIERFPAIAFRTSAIKVGSGGDRLDDRVAHQAVVEGTLSLHGVDRALQFPATIRYDGATLTAEGEATVRLTDHGIAIPKFLWIVLDDDVQVRFHLVATPAGSLRDGAATPAGSAATAPAASGPR